MIVLQVMCEPNLTYVEAPARGHPMQLIVTPEGVENAVVQQIDNRGGPIRQGSPSNNSTLKRS